MQLKGLRLDDDLSFNFTVKGWFGERGKQVRNLIKENNDLRKIMTYLNDQVNFDMEKVYNFSLGFFW